MAHDFPWQLVTVSVLSFALISTLIEPEESFDQANPAPKFLSPPPEYIEHFAFGFRHSMADSYWLRWIQDSDYCQTYLSPVEILPPKPLYAFTDAIIDNPRHRKCDNSWSFKMLDVVTKLDEKFEMPYLLGAVSLSVLVEDYDGADVIFQRGIKQYPENWGLLYRAAYHFLFDRRDVKYAAELLTRAADHGGPIWLRSLAARLYTKSGQIGLGISILENYLKAVENPRAKEDIAQRIEELKKHQAAASSDGP